jgi:hypothetical protein
MQITTGQRVRITLLEDVVGVDNDAEPLYPPELTPISDRSFIAPLQLPIKVYATHGTVYEGIVSDVDEDGFFELNVDSGDSLGFYAHDATIRIEVLE